MSVDVERVQELLESTTTAILITDDSGVVKDANEAAARLLAVERRFLLGKPLVAFVPLPVRSAFRADLRRLVQAGGGTVKLTIASRGRPAVETLAYVTTPPNWTGRFQWALHEVSPNFETVVNRLVEERTQLLLTRAADAEHQLERLQAALSDVSVGIAIVGWPSWELLFANEYLLALDHGSGEARSPSMAFPSFLGPDSRLRELVQRRGKVSGEIVEVMGSAGRALTLEVTAARAKTPVSRAEVVVVVAVDRSEQRRRDDAEADFIANAAHQLHNPLTALSTAVEVLQSGAKHDPEERERFLQRIEEETIRLTRLSRALLMLARLQARDASPPSHIVFLRPLLERLGAAIQPAPGVDVAVMGDDDIVVLAPPDLLEEALTNVLENAAKYTQRGSIRVTCEWLGANRARIVVADTGIGIEPADLDRIFDRFVRAAPDRAGAAGLGLAITRDILHAVGGEITAESTPGRGSSFAVVLPSHHELKGSAA